MKKLIIPILMLSISPFALSKIYQLELDESIRVMCVNDYVFVHTYNRETMVQMMRQSPPNNQKSHATPMTCEEYIVSSVRKELEEGKD